LELLNYPEI